MRVNTPMTPEEWKTADEKARKAGEANKRMLREVADKIEQGEALTSLERAYAAGALRSTADGIGSKAPGKRNAKKIPDDFPMQLKMYAKTGKMSKDDVLGHFVTKFDVSIEALKKFLKTNK